MIPANIVFLALSLYCGGDAPKKEDLPVIPEGRWSLWKSEEKGKVVKVTREEEALVIIGRTIEWIDNDGGPVSYDGFTYAISRDEHGLVIELTYLRGRDKGKKHYSRFKIDKETISFCMTNARNPNQLKDVPKQLGTKARGDDGAGTILLVFKRVDPKQAKEKKDKR
jgi:hypothetical protein